MTRTGQEKPNGLKGDEGNTNVTTGLPKKKRTYNLLKKKKKKLFLTASNTTDEINWKSFFFFFFLKFHKDQTLKGFAVTFTFTPFFSKA